MFTNSKPGGGYLNSLNKKKGFTLIELLAVIVILAIIALITVPIILNMIKTAKKKAAVSAAYGYIDAINYNNDLASMKSDYTDMTYELTTTGEDLNVTTINEEVIMKGKKPTSGTVNINSKGKVVSASNLCFEGYPVDYDGKTATIDTNATCGSNSSSSNNNSGSNSGTAQTLTKAVYESSSTSWADIKASATTLGDDLVGAERTIEMDVDENGTNETYHIVVVNKTACTTETSESACGLVLQFKELLNISVPDDKKMNLTSTSAGGWPASKMYTYLNETIYNKLPSDLKTAIKTTKTISGYESGVSTNYTSNNDKLYLLSTKEVGFDLSSDSAKTETRKLDYYDAGTGTDANAKRVKYNYGTTTASYWWLRSARSGNTNTFSSVKSGGSIDSRNAYSASGVAPAFRVG